MSFFQTSETRQDRPARSWILETMVVLGILAFGYFATTFDKGARTVAAPAQTVGITN